MCFSNANKAHHVIPAKAGIHHAGITTIAEEVEGSAFQQFSLLLYFTRLDLGEPIAAVPCIDAALWMLIYISMTRWVWLCWS